MEDIKENFLNLKNAASVYGISIKQLRKMKAAPPITDFVVSDDFKVVITFEGMAPRVVDLKTFNLLGPKAKRLGNDLKYLKSFVLADGVPEWEGLALLGPEDLLEASAPHQDYEVASSFKDRVKAKYDLT